MAKQKFKVVFRTHQNDDDEIVFIRGGKSPVEFSAYVFADDEKINLVQNLAPDEATLNHHAQAVRYFQREANMYQNLVDLITYLNHVDPKTPLSYELDFYWSEGDLNLSIDIPRSHGAFDPIRQKMDGQPK